MERLVQDLRYASRMLLKNPGFSALAIVTLALGLGANIGIFSVVNSILLKPLSYADPARLVVALHDGQFPVSPADFLDYRRAARSFEQMAAAQGWGATLTGREAPETITGMQITPNMIPLLGVSPLLGRGFDKAEDKQVLLSYALWKRRFGGDNGILGQKLTLNGEPYTVAGIMPPSFHFAPFWITRSEMWVPLSLANRINDRAGRSLRVFARLRAGVSVQQAGAEMSAIAHRLAAAYPKTNAKLDMAIVPLQEKVVGAVRPTLLVLLGTVGFVLLIACANVANLMLTRAVARRKEVALRLAMGAGRTRLIRQLLTESVLISGLGGLAGLALASWGVGLLNRMLPLGSLPRQQELGLDSDVFLFALTLALLTGVVSGLMPAWQMSRAGLNEALKEGSRSVTKGTGRGLLVGAEVALALVLLAGAGLMIRTMQQLQSVNAGFDPGNLLTMTVSLAGTPHNSDGARVPKFAEVQRSLESVPGVASVSAINHLPIGGDVWTLDYRIEGRPEPAPGEGPGAVYRVVRPGYFDTMRMRLVRGRDFTEQDRTGTPDVAVINETMARRQWPGADPLGKRVLYGGTPGAARSYKIIVGVVRDARQGDWTSAPNDEIFLPYLQRANVFGLSSLTFVIRCHTAPASMAVSLRQVVSAQGLAVSDVQTMEQVIGDKLWRSRLATFLLGLFACVALTLAAIGIYGVIAYSVRQRTQEIGIRMALGARQADVARMALREGMAPVVAGAICGVGLALLATRLMKTLLYEVKPTDPMTYALVTAMLIGVAAVANYIPARRAARVDPLVALRYE